MCLRAHSLAFPFFRDLHPGFVPYEMLRGDAGSNAENFIQTIVNFEHLCSSLRKPRHATNAHVVPACGRRRPGDRYRMIQMQSFGRAWGNVDPLTADFEAVWTELPKPTQFGTRLLLEQWRAREAAGGFVVGRDVPSRALACVLRNLVLYEPVDADADFRIRVAGTALMRRFGRDVTGLRLSEIYSPRNFELRRAAMLAVIATSKPHCVDVKLAGDRRVFLRFEALRLPVWSPNRLSAWVLGGFFCFE